MDSPSDAHDVLDQQTPISPSSPVDFYQTSKLHSLHSRTSSTTSSNRTSKSVAVTAVRPPPSYISPSLGAEFIEEQRRNDSDVNDEDDDDGRAFVLSDRGLAMINMFLDQMLFNFLAVSRSSSLPTLRRAIEQVLKGKLARQAIDSADEDLEGLLNDSDEDEELDKVSPGEEAGVSWDTELYFRRSRLRIMSYTKLGEMDDQEETRHLHEVYTSVAANSNKRYSETLGLVSWAAAIFLTAVLEYVGEVCLAYAGQAAHDRYTAKRAKNVQQSLESLDTPDDAQITVIEQDVERLALSPMIGRLWRTWRKLLKSPKSRTSASYKPLARTQSVTSSAPGTAASVNEDEPSATDGSANGMLDDKNLRETRQRADSQRAAADSPTLAEALQADRPQDLLYARRPHSLVISPAYFQKTMEEDESLHSGRPGLTRARSSSMPIPKKTTSEQATDDGQILQPKRHGDNRPKTAHASIPPERNREVATANIEPTLATDPPNEEEGPVQEPSIEPSPGNRDDAGFVEQAHASENETKINPDPGHPTPKSTLGPAAAIGASAVAMASLGVYRGMPSKRDSTETNRTSFEDISRHQSMIPDPSKVENVFAQGGNAIPRSHPAEEQTPPGTTQGFIGSRKAEDATAQEQVETSPAGKTPVSSSRSSTADAPISPASPYKIKKTSPSQASSGNLDTYPRKESREYTSGSAAWGSQSPKSEDRASVRRLSDVTSPSKPGSKPSSKPPSRHGSTNHDVPALFSQHRSRASKESNEEYRHGLSRSRGGTTDRDFDDLIAGQETVKYTLTPKTLSEIEQPESPRIRQDSVSVMADEDLGSLAGPPASVDTPSMARIVHSSATPVPVPVPVATPASPRTMRSHPNQARAEAPSVTKVTNIQTSVHPPPAREIRSVQPSSRQQEIERQRAKEESSTSKIYIPQKPSLETIEQYIARMPPGTQIRRVATASSRQSPFSARDAQIRDGSTRDFADFIRSTAPDKAGPAMSWNTDGAGASASQQITPRASRTPLNGMQANGNSFAGNTKAVASSVPSSPTAANARMAQKKFVPRDATVTQNTSNDLIAFLRESEPPSANRQGATIQGKSPPGMHSRGFGDNSTLGSTNRDSSLHSTASGKVSVNSQSNLLGQPPMSPSGAGNMPAVGRKQYRNKDPYAIPDDSDEDETNTGTRSEGRVTAARDAPAVDDNDDELIMPVGKNSSAARKRRDDGGGESMLDFLRNTAPPGYKPSPVTSTPASPGSFRSASTPAESAAVRKEISPIPENIRPPAGFTAQHHRQYLSDNLSSYPQPSIRPNPIPPPSMSGSASPKPSDTLKARAYSSTTTSTAVGSPVVKVPDFLSTPYSTGGVVNTNGAYGNEAYARSDAGYGKKEQAIGRKESKGMKGFWKGRKS